LGGDEFVVLLSEIAHIGDADGVAEKMLILLASSHHITPHEINMTISIGISVFPDDGQDPETLIRNADIALYHAKNSGRNNAKVFTQHMHSCAVEQRSLESGLRGALSRGEFELHYQPKVRLATGEITGAEALIRWHHPDRGNILPNLFIPIAEESHLIVQIGEWVLREACRQAQAWRNCDLKIDQIAVNISAIEFQAPGFLERVKTILEETGFDPHCLELEMTESVLMEHAESTCVLLGELKRMGLRLAIDDFGTGYSSLSYLSRFPIDTLKIDQSFVHKMISDSNCATIVSTVISMGKSLNQRVVAEGVETPEQLIFLQARQCEEGQGHHFRKPLNAKEFAAILGAGLSGGTVDSETLRKSGNGTAAWAMGESSH
jgi:diguanylate cyclase